MCCFFSRCSVFKCSVFMLFLLVFSTACSRRSAPAEGDSCRAFDECAATSGLVCVDETCQQVACARTFDCPVQAACVGGVCGVAECLINSDCGVGSCFEGDCREDLCESRAECEQGLVCRGFPSTCQTPLDVCEDNEDCPVGLACKPETGECVAACSAALPCADTQWCDDGLCRAVCGEDTSRCDSGERCLQGLCRAPLDCSEYPECGADAPRQDPFTCQCFECSQDQDCQISRQEVCIEGSCIRCVSTPQNTESCPAQGYFQASESCCVECDTDADCDVGAVCEAGQCIDTRNRPCDSDDECPSPLFCDGRQCVDQGSLSPCTFQSDCSVGEACYGDGRCHQQSTTCAAGCRAPSRCIAPVGVSAGGSCVGCQELCSEDECPDSQRCYIPEGDAEGWCVAQDFWSSICAE